MRLCNYFIAAALMVALVSCAVQEPVKVKDGKEYGVTEGLFRERWWNYFERGMSYTEGDFHRDAIADFMAAIEQREDDGWRSRTYGMHFVDYFPHRELGVVYFKMGNFSRAEKELEQSLGTAESAKAKYYLDKTRKAILDEMGADVDAPEIIVHEPADGFVTNRLSLAVRGEARDDYFVSTVNINGTPQLIELSAQHIAFEKNIDLRKGSNSIVISSTDLTGKNTEKSIIVNVDRDGPVIILDDVTVRGQKVSLSGYLFDRTGIDSFSLNGRSAGIVKVPDFLEDDFSDDAVTELQFVQEVELPEGENGIALDVTDIVGNRTEGEVIVEYESMAQNNLFAAAPVQVAGIGDSLRKILDNIPPSINLKGLADMQTVFIDSVFLEGSVSDNSKIVSLLVNGESVLMREGKKVFFNYLTRLKEGINRFFIESEDNYGNKSEKIIQVTREIPRVRKLGSRMSLSLLPLEHKGRISVPGQTVPDNLMAAFVNQRRFHLIEREKLDDVLSELRLSQTELADPDNASKIGRIVTADAILTGSVYETGNSMEVITRLVDSETAAVMDVVDVFGENISLAGVKNLMEGLATKYRQIFPLVDGLVLKKDGNSVLIDFGSEQNIREGMGVLLFREGEAVRHPLSGQILGNEPEELGEAKIEKVFEKFSRAALRKGKAAAITVEDRVITK